MGLRRKELTTVKKLIDLHTHSVMSDGSMTPAEVVAQAADAGLSAIALSDHDVIDGVKEAREAGEKLGVEIVPAIELSAQSETETHILGFDIDTENELLLHTLSEAKKLRYQRNIETAENLQRLGFDVTMEEALALAPNGIVGRAHFARLMTMKGYVSSVKEGFDKWLTNGRPAYSSTQYLTDEQAVRLIKDAGGKAFVAHLHLMRKDDDELVSFLKRLKSIELDGVEGYYTEYTPEMQQKYQALACELGLKISGGTDFHGAMKPHISIGRGLGNMEIPYEVLENIRRDD